jgi:integrase
MRQAQVFGVRPKRSFRVAATKYLNENAHKRSIETDMHHLKMLNGFIGGLSIDAVHMGNLQQFISARKLQGVKTKTINGALAVVRHLLNMAASEWIDDNNLTWLAIAPKIKLLKVTDARKPYPLSWEEQTAFFKELPSHLQPMALFKVNTGCRDGEVCNLRWEWEVQVPELNTSVFIIPDVHVKNGDERLVVLNHTAKSVIDSMRGKHPDYVFTYNGKPTGTMHNSGWQNARSRVGLEQVRVHDLKHTFGRRLRAAGVSFEDRQDLLGHKTGKITTHYSAAELESLIAAANTVCQMKSRKSPALVMLKQKMATA